LSSLGVGYKRLSEPIKKPDKKKYNAFLLKTFCLDFFNYRAKKRRRRRRNTIISIPKGETGLVA
jgi:hypothetical protein